MNAPVAIGGLGGSGTRVVAAMVREAGYYLGADLNRALDNLWYTVLLKRRHLDAAAEAAALEVFLAGMRGELERTERTLQVLTQAATDVSLYGHDASGADRGAWAFKRIVSLLQAQERPPARPWGWKEPNTHLRLPALCDRVDDLRYVHVVRHGLDMAFSANQRQLAWWGPTLGIDVPTTPEALPRAALRYWAVTTHKVLEFARNRPDLRLLLLRFEDVCEYPRATVERLLTFLDGPTDIATISRLAALPQTPPSVGRHRGVNPRVFDDRDLALLEQLGYAVG